MGYLISIIIVLIILIGAFNGWKTGGFSSLIAFVGSIAILYLAYYLKDYINVFLYDNLPFLEFEGLFNGVSSINILLYDGISYIICLFGLSIILGIIVKITGLVDKLFKSTVILAFPSRLIGLLFGALEFYLIAFALCYIFLQIPLTSSYIKDSYLANLMLDETPVLKDVIDDTYTSISDIYNICEENQDETDRTKVDYMALDKMLEHNLVTIEEATKLITNNKIVIPNYSMELISKYSEN